MSFRQSPFAVTCLVLDKMYPLETKSRWGASFFFKFIKTWFSVNIALFLFLIPPSSAVPLYNIEHAYNFQTAGKMAGTWKGSIACGNEGTGPIEFKVGQKGNPIFRYITKAGTREVEITHVGQNFAFVPPEGGVSRIKVISLTVGANRIFYSLHQTNESTSGGTLYQEQGEAVFDAILSGTVLDLKIKMQLKSVLSQPGLVVPGENNSIECNAKLRKN